MTRFLFALLGGAVLAVVCYGVYHLLTWGFIVINGRTWRQPGDWPLIIAGFGALQGFSHVMEHWDSLRVRFGLKA